MPSTRSAEKRARSRNLAAAAAAGGPTPLRRSPRGIKMQAVEEEPLAAASPEKFSLPAVASAEKPGSQRKRAAGQAPVGAPPARKAAKGSRNAVSEEIAAGEEPVDEIDEYHEEEDEAENKEQQPGRELAASAAHTSPAKKRVGCSRKPRKDDDSEECCFVGNPVPMDEAKSKWPERYKRHASGSSITMSDPDLIPAKRHYLQANVDGVVYNLYDDAYIKAEDGEPDYIGRIVEFFESTKNEMYFTAQWFFRAEDTVMKEHALCHANAVHDSKRVFLSNEKNDNTLDCIVSKIKIERIQPNIDLKAKQKSIPPCDLYYDMSYSLAYSAFSNLLSDETRMGSDSSTISSESDVSSSENKNSLSLLDLYSGCGAMSTGLCLGAELSGTNLETRWAVDFNKYACESLKLNHPKTEVRNEKAEDFLQLLVEWEKLCKKYDLIGRKNSAAQEVMDDSDEEEEVNSDQVPGDEFEVGRIVGICYGDPHEIGKVGLKFKVRWKGYGPSEDTWEPIDGLSKCDERIEDFVKKGFQKNILPLPGDADVICGGPPCQGISGFNRFRNRDAPLEDPKNQQMVVYMDIVEFLKPRFVLMENVVDILKFANGFLGRYALSRLVSLNYQARLGMMVAGCYGLPQFRMRVFLWGALPTETLPQFPLPTHDVVIRGGVPNEFEQNAVAYDATQKPKLNKALFLEDALSDLPKITNFESRDEMPYTSPPKTEFQRFIRLSRMELLQSSSTKDQSYEKHQLYDHRPLQLNEDDYQRVCQIPKRKGANFRDLPGVMVGPDNISMLDPNVERVMLPSGKPLVPDYAITFVKGKSSKPFGRLWWDETVPTVVTRAEPHNQALLHPVQDRVLSIRENARLQGFPDFYKLCGPIKERYIQVGNAVAVPVARALGYGLGLSVLGNGGCEPLFTLPQCFPLHQEQLSRTDESAESI